jgi:ATP-dependent Zn protease
MQLVKGAYSEAKAALIENRELIEIIVEYLVNYNTLTGDKVLTIMREHQRVNKKYII